MTTWSPQQNEALAKAGAWLRLKYAPTFYLAGYAGSGKTTLAMHLADHAKGKVAFAAFTGKAARVMRSKGCKGARTIHSLIYVTEVDDATGQVTTHLRPPQSMEETCLIIIDECSMVDEEIGKDLLSFGKPILVLGDPAQLPPISGAGYFTSRQPDYMLTEVHRQAAESPIIWLATEIRQGRFKPQDVNTDGLIVTQKRYLDPSCVTDADAVLVGRNDTRQSYNARLRQLAGKKRVTPEVGEPLICLRNDRGLQIYNGDILTVDKAFVKQGKVSLTLSDPDGERDPVKAKVLQTFFENDVVASKLPYSELKGTQQFAFGYAITCHKAQGSQWANVCVFDESRTFRENADRWLYTAVTRAADHLTLVI